MSTRDNYAESVPASIDAADEATQESIQGVPQEPKQPLSSYNLFFQFERQRIIDGTDKEGAPISPRLVHDILNRKKADKDKTSKRNKRLHKKTHGKISFQALARTIGSRWKALDQSTRALFEFQASLEKQQYTRKKQEWKDFLERKGKNESSVPACAETASEEKPDQPWDSHIISSGIKPLEHRGVGMVQPHQEEKPPELSSIQVSRRPLQASSHLSLGSIANRRVLLLGNDGVQAAPARSTAQLVRILANGTGALRENDSRHARSQVRIASYESLGPPQQPTSNANVQNHNQTSGFRLGTGETACDTSGPVLQDRLEGELDEEDNMIEQVMDSPIFEEARTIGIDLFRIMEGDEFDTLFDD